MNKLTKVGLTALASTMVVASANAADWSISGGASISYTNISTNSGVNPFAFGDSLTFSASGDLDGGISISTSMELDGNSMDDRKIALSSDEMGTVSITSSLTAGGIGRIADMVPTAGEEVYDVVDGDDNGLATTGISSTNQIGWVSPALGGVTVSAGYTKLAKESDSSWTLEYDASDMIDGLSAGYGVADNGTTSENETLYVKYTMGGLTFAWQESTVNYDATGTSDEDAQHIGASFAVNENLTVSVGQHIVEMGGVNDEESQGMSASYTMGSMKFGAFSNKTDNIAGAAGTNATASGVNVSFTF
jgi:outer membrane protein OmpU